MAEVSATLFFRGNRKYSVGALDLDLIISESHKRSNIVTERKIEDGSIISDHIQADLASGSLTGLISNFSISTEGLTTNRSQDAFDILERIMTAGELVTITTVLKVYQNVAITNLNVVRNSATGEALTFDVSFKQGKIVKLQEVVVETSVSIANMDNDTNRQAAPELDAGRTVGD